jgi:CBS domain containing-hemolysin-like protein
VFLNKVTSPYRHRYVPAPEYKSRYPIFPHRLSLGKSRGSGASVNFRGPRNHDTEPITVSPDDDLEEAVELMIEEKIGGIRVVDEAEGLVGIVTYVDVLRCFLNRLQED